MTNRVFAIYASALFGVMLSLGLARSGYGAFLWIEAESAAEKEVFPNPWWEGVRRKGLSGEDFVASFSEPQNERGSVTYKFEAPEAGEYELWIRGAMNGLAYELNGGGQVEISTGDIKKEDNQKRNEFRDAQRKYEREKQRDQDAELEEPVQPQARYQDERNLAIDGTTDARYYAWINLASVELQAGQNTLKLWLGPKREKPEEKPYGAVDAIVLTNEGFQPNGQFKPGQENPNIVPFVEENYWAFDMEEDSFSDEAVIDLRSMNEKVAGENGFIKLSEDKMSFLRGDGQPIRFWGGSEYHQREAWDRHGFYSSQLEQAEEAGNAERAEQIRQQMKETREAGIESIHHKARFLAKRGVNIVRWHGHLPKNLHRNEREKGKTSSLSEVDEVNLEKAFLLVAAMKEAGIYTILSPYWGSHTDIEPSWNLKYHPENGNLAALVFFSPEIQDAYKSWLRELYTRENPFTGIPLKDDPAVAIIQLQNEDSMLFWTMQRVGGEAENLLRKQFGEWLKNKYGSMDAVKERWQGCTEGYLKDDFDKAMPDLFMVWEFTTDAMNEKAERPGFLERRADQLNFFGETMYNFNKEIGRYLKEDLGCKQLVNAGNWKTVDPILVEDVERWAYTANEVVAKNHYFGALHTGRTRGWQILRDNIFTNKSGTKVPMDLPTNCKQVVGHPFIIPESLWVPPNRYESEGPLMIACQQSLNGVDTFYWFASGTKEWTPAASGGSLPKWNYTSPMQLGQFPANAVLWRKGYLKEGKPVVIERRPLEDLWDGTKPIVGEGGSFDPNRDSGNAAPDIELDSPVDEKVFLVGPVHVEYGKPAEETFIADYEKFIDEENGIVRANTGEIEIHHKEGIYKVMSPKAQGAAGFLGEAGEIDLGEVKINCRNDHASVVVVSLDDKPIAESEKLLLQTGTYQRPKGFTTEKIELVIKEEPTEAFRIMDVGDEDAPWHIRKAEGKISIKNSVVQSAVVLDANLMDTGRSTSVKKDGEWLEVQLPEDTLYVVLKK